MIKIKKGLDLPIDGTPEQKIYDGPEIKQVAVLGVDYIGMRPTMKVQVGDKVKLGDLLFIDKKTPGVKYTSPASGTVAEINRGEKRALQSVVIDVDYSSSDSVEFNAYSSAALESIDVADAKRNLIDSGLWASFRTRPFSKTPAPESTPNSIFVTAMDSNPLAADAKIIITENKTAFKDGLKLISRLTTGKIFICSEPNASIPGNDIGNAVFETFSGPHPAGLAGTHIHHLDPVSATKTVWSINYQDVIAIGKLFTTGKIFVERVISLAGPAVKKPRLIRTRVGASTNELTQDELVAGENRIVSGSVLTGRHARKDHAFLGRYHQQVSVLAEGYEREFVGWMVPGVNKFSAMRIFVSKLFPGKKFKLNTSTNGSRRAMVPIGAYEKVMPLDIIPTFLLRSLIVNDGDQAQLLGCLELDEEDLGLCTFVCPGKYEYGEILRNNLTQIEKEG